MKNARFLGVETECFYTNKLYKITIIATHGYLTMKTNTSPASYGHQYHDTDIKKVQPERTLVCRDWLEV
jgi:hypothetical protein